MKPPAEIPTATPRASAATVAPTPNTITASRSRAKPAWSGNDSTSSRHGPTTSSPPTRHVHRTYHLLCAMVVLLLALVCLSWTLWLALLTASPTATVNRVMKTEHLDFGAFWRLSEVPTGVVSAGVAGLAGVALGYVLVLYQLMSIIALSCQRHGPNTKRKTSIHRLSAQLGMLFGTTVRPSDVRGSSIVPTLSTRHVSTDLKHHASQLAVDILNHESRTRRYLHVLVKVADLTIQCVYVAQFLEAGVPVELLSLFAATVALNALAAAMMVARSSDHRGRMQLLVDSAFDFVVALAFPVIVLLYALRSFTFDQTLLAINTEVFPPGFYEHVAAVVADPVEVATVRRTLDALRIDSVMSIFTCVGTSATLCRRFFGLVDLLRAQQAGLSVFPNVYPKQHRRLAAVFLLVGVAVVVITTGSVRSSSAACAMHPECVRIAHRWIIGRAHDDATRCPCLAMIDGNVAITSYAEWDKPFDRTMKLAQLASCGDLRTLQLVNRALPKFPVELRRCKSLKHVSLYYTETVTMPDWFAEFAHLEFLHVEGKALHQSFQHLPTKLFDNMRELTYVHLALQGLEQLPSVDGLVSLQTFTLGALPFLMALPSFDRLEKLERLTVAGTPRIETFPDLTHVPNLQALIVADRGTFCCNGFLGPDKCELSRSLCQRHLWGTPAVTQCLPSDRVATPATRTYFNAFPFSACYGEAARTGEFKLSPTPEDMAPCNGTLYKQCEAATPGGIIVGMCYNTRWMAVACDPSPFPIEMRRRQIALGRGQPCNPQHEAWLGCRE